MTLRPEEVFKQVGGPPPGFDNLVAASMFMVGWVVAKEGFDADPLEFMATALIGVGIKSHYLDEIVNRASVRKFKP